MRRRAVLAGLLATPLAPMAQPARALILVGDSTLAPETGFGQQLCALLPPNVACFNQAKGGRSSKSFRAEGLWDEVLALIARQPGALVIVQFGHNDQPGKPGRSTDLVTEYPANLRRYLDEARAAGATPLLVTPLTRRSFGEGGQLKNDLRPWAETGLRIAAEAGVASIDLNAKSAALVQALGQTEADTLAMAPPPPEGPASVVVPPGGGYRGFDRTHVGAKGAALFAQLMRRELAPWVDAAR